MAQTQSRQPNLKVWHWDTTLEPAAVATGSFSCVGAVGSTRPPVLRAGPYFGEPTGTIACSYGVPAHIM